MSTPETSATPDDSQKQAVTPTLEEKLAISEKRRKDTQAGYTKGQQSLKSLEAENNKLKELIGKQVTVNLSTEEQDKLDTLKFEDPAAWRTQLNKLEEEASIKSRANLNELTGEAKLAAEQTFELDRRQTVLKAFNDSAKVVITEELITNEVPPRITKKLESGKTTWEEFLTEVETYVTTNKIVKNDEVLGQPNMGNLGGSGTPQDMKPEDSLSASYKKDLY